MERCEVFRSLGYDPTGENMVECNAPAEYCPVCELNTCFACHIEMGFGPGSGHLIEAQPKKSPTSAKSEDELSRNRHKA